LLKAVIRLLESVNVGFHSDCIDARIGTAPARHFLERLQDVDFLVVQRLRSSLFGFA
jgi:hypothetical protein